MKSVIREATIEDLPAIVAIYNQAVRQKIASCEIYGAMNVQLHQILRNTR